MLHIGDILNPHGLKGAFIVYSHTRPADAVAGYLSWHLGKTAEQTQPFEVQRCWQHGKRTLAMLDGIQSFEQAESLKGLKIWVSGDDVHCDDDEYLWQDLIGCVVYTQDDVVLGKVSNVYAFGAQDTLEIKTLADATERGEWLLPFVEDVVLAVDTAQQRIEVTLIEGMDACFTPKS
ncbi:MAG: ribosome maturation factor RimM [Mariprofundaceae bacterium]|nr:ribosome maturation factor RimM [Mariprofundaceae bacterium]